MLNKILIITLCLVFLFLVYQGKFFKKKIIKIIKAKHVYGLKYYNNELYLSHVFTNYISKIDLDKKNEQKKLINLNNEWEKNPNIEQGKLKGIHSVDFLKNKFFFLASYLEKKIYLYDFKKKNIIQFNKLNKILKGPSHIYFDKSKNLLIISDYDGGEVYLLNILNKRISKLSDKSKIELSKPHMVIKKNNIYYTLDTNLKKIYILDDNFIKIEEIITNDINFDLFPKYKESFFETIVSIKIDNLGNLYISDVGKNNCIYVINKNKKLFGIIENKKIKIRKNTYYLNNLNLDKIYDLIVSDNIIYIASTHTDELYQIRNLFLTND